METGNAKSRLCAFLLKSSAAVLLLSVATYAYPAISCFFLGILFTLCLEVYILYWFMLTDSEFAARIATFYAPTTLISDKERSSLAIASGSSLTGGTVLSPCLPHVRKNSEDSGSSSKLLVVGINEKEKEDPRSNKPPGMFPFLRRYNSSLGVHEPYQCTYPRKGDRKELCKMKEEMGKESEALSASLDEIGRYFKSHGSLEAEMAKSYKAARKSVTKMLVQIEGCAKAELSGKIAFEMIRDPITEQNGVLANWTMVRNTLGLIGKIHEDFGQFVTKGVSGNIEAQKAQCEAALRQANASVGQAENKLSLAKLQVEKLRKEYASEGKVLREAIDEHNIAVKGQESRELAEKLDKKEKILRKRVDDLTAQLNAAIDTVCAAENTFERELQIALQIIRETRDKHYYIIKCTFFSFTSLFVSNNAELAELGEFLLKQGKPMRRDSDLLLKLNSKTKLSAFSARKATDDRRLFIESPIFPNVSDTFAEQSDSVMDIVDNINPDKSRLLQSTERILLLYKRAENNASTSLKLWEHLRCLSNQLFAGVKSYGEKLRKYVEKRRNGLLAGFADHIVAENVTNILIRIAGLYSTCGNAMEKLTKQMEDKMRLELTPEILNDQCKPHLFKLEHLYEDIKRNTGEIKIFSGFAEGQQKAESELGKGVMILDDIVRRAQHCGIRFRRKFAKQFYLLIAEQTVQVSILQSLIERVADGYEGLSSVLPRMNTDLSPREDRKESQRKDVTRDEEPAEEIPREKLGQGVPQRIRLYKLIPRMKREEVKRWKSSKTVSRHIGDSGAKFSTFYNNDSREDVKEACGRIESKPVLPCDKSPLIVESLCNNNPSQDDEWWNRLLNTFYQTWKQSSVFSDGLKRLCTKIYNQDRPSFLGEITVNSVALTNHAPEISKVTVLPAGNPEDFLCEFDISYKGNFQLDLSCNFILNWPMKETASLPLNCKVQFQRLAGKVRLFFSSNETRRCWYGFVNEPTVKFDVDPVLGRANRLPVNLLPQVSSFLVGSLTRRVRGYVLPNTRTIAVPATETFGRIP